MGTHPIFESDFDCLTEKMVSDNAAMALDDYIAKSKIGKGGRGGNRGGGRSRDGGRPNRDRGGDRGGDRGRVNKRRDYDDRPPRRGRNMDDNWEHDLYSGGRGGRGSARAASKLLVDNLDFGVTDADMEELFGEFGDLRKATILYDRSGRSTGQAEIEFTRASDAERAKEQYNGVPLDGRAMTITIVGGGGDDGGFRSRIGKRDRSRSRSPRRNYSPRGGRRGGGQRNGGGRGGGRGGQREKKEEVTQEQLDKEMEEYLNQKK